VFTSRRAILILLLMSTTAWAQDDDDEQPPGLRGRYVVNQAVVERVDSDLSFDWGSAPPDERLPSGKFSARWAGTILLRTEGRYQFHAFLQGTTTLTVNGQPVLNAQADTPRWVSGPETSLAFGDQPLVLTYVRTGETAQLKLFWSSSDFPLELVPYHALFQTQPAADLNLVERGRVQFDAYRCGNCHYEGPAEKVAANLDRLDAPSLTHVGVGTVRDRLVEKLMLGSGNPPVQAKGKMPHFGFTRTEAEEIVAALQSRSTSVKLTSPVKLKDSERAKDLQAGNTLIRSVGCLACHSWNSLGDLTDYGGGSLDEVAGKRSADWLSTWLVEPARLNSRHRMPVVSLSDKERSQITLALLESINRQAGAPIEPMNPVNEAAIARGIKLIEESRCVLCHEIPGQVSSRPAAKEMTDSGVDWERGCMKPADRTRNRPSFPFADARAIRAFLASRPPGTLTKPNVGDETSAGMTVGMRWLERKNCLGCHDRDDRRGISRHAADIVKGDESLSGMQMLLIPPRLNAVGDRMHDAGLAEAIRGEQKSPRLNWLHVRMPKFAHTPIEQASIMRALIQHDRIPVGSPQKEILPQQTANGAAADPQRILAGRELLGGKGFSCVACHAVKDYTPKVTALGTRGSNLHMIGQRMRTDYFFRWTRAPLRVMPGVEMPNYQRPHEFILPGQLDQQLIAIWDALNDPNLTAPTNPAVVEQLLAVGERDEPRVVRDVFTVPGTPDETVARAYAIGLPAGHSILLDLESGTVRAWTLGDFARQRCEGKRWYWDLAGTILASRFDSRPDILLVDDKTGEWIAPETGWSVKTRFNRELRGPQSVQLFYDVVFSRDGVKHELKDVTDRFSVLEENGVTGWNRKIVVQPSGSVWPWFRNSKPAMAHELSRITPDGVQGTPAPGLPPTAVKFSREAVGGLPSLSVNYQTSLRWQLPQQASSPALISKSEPITTVPGFQGRRLPLPRSIMPTAMTWDRAGRLVFTSLKGHLYRMDSPEGSLTAIEEGLAAPFGVIELPAERGAESELFEFVVAHKPELIQLGVNPSGRIGVRSVYATGWGVTDDYHDWTCGIVRDSAGDLYIGLGSDYTFKNRPVERSRWRGDILRIDRMGKVESIATGLRYPTGLAMDDRDRLFCSDQQGVQNTFNELNHIQTGHRYGVPSRHEPKPDAAADPPAIQIPHPWTRSVNGIVCVPKSATDLAPIAGHFLGCEFNNNILIRMSLQTVDDVVQGAVYQFSKPAREGDSSNFVGPLCIGISPRGVIHVGSLQDGGWAGGLNMGNIVTLTCDQAFLNGIREIRATRHGFEIQFFHKVDSKLAIQPEQYKISGYTRVWKGDYATPDAGHHAGEVTAARMGQDGMSVELTVHGLKTGHVYDISVGEIGTEDQRALWPALGHYTLHRIPR
jgi:cbb3-type cytochrome oxidase cytochrome c subunit